MLLVFYKTDIDETILKQDDTSKAWFWNHLLDAKAEIVRIGILTFFINLCHYRAYVYHERLQSRHPKFCN